MTDPFVLHERLGRGAMGEVYRSIETATGTTVALKLLYAHLASDPAYRERFAREADLASRVDSPHVVKVLGYGIRHRRPYLALEYVAGVTLRDTAAAHGPYSWPETRELLAQVASGLAAIHTAGVLHRDLKPSNILVTADGVAKITDFGIAKGQDLTALTASAAMLGTPTYLAPEGSKDERSDLYGLGVIAYELLAGVPPFTGDSQQAVILAHVRTAPDLRRIPPEARPIVGALLAKDPRARPQSASALLAALAPGVNPRFTAPTLTRDRTPTPWPDPALASRRSRAPLLVGVGITGLTVLVLVAAVAMGLFQPKPSPGPTLPPFTQEPSTAAPATPTPPPSPTPVLTPTVGPTGSPSASPSTREVAVLAGCYATMRLTKVADPSLKNMVSSDVEGHYAWPGPDTLPTVSGTVLTVSGLEDGGQYSPNCQGLPDGHTWWVVVAINGVRVQDLPHVPPGVDRLYSASLLSK